MNPGDLDRTLSTLAAQAAAVRERLSALSGEVSAARAVIEDIAGALRDSASRPERAQNGTSEPAKPQAKAAYK
ncbi:MAG TPA: hypothetical protein VFG83_02610 [Kofleriaceae bacterium]|nr:hypothetical protein [Kofleriaceae bacterium]